MEGFDVEGVAGADVLLEKNNNNNNRPKQKNSC